MGGIAVLIAGMAVDLALLGHERRIVISILVANSVAGLVAIVAGLAFQLNQEESHFRFAMEKAAAIAELNHHVRNAVFPLFLAVQRSNDAESNRLANEAMSRIDIALRDASVDAYSGKVRYAEQAATSIAA
ncbi:MAG TPA: hypothetical protein VFB04_08910 [Terriglobales bacterium]|nr:hypothetical protein [Terriglobales bacterium]